MYYSEKTWLNDCQKSENGQMCHTKHDSQGFWSNIEGRKGGGPMCEAESGESEARDGGNSALFWDLEN